MCLKALAVTFSINETSLRLLQRSLTWSTTKVGVSFAPGHLSLWKIVGNLMVFRGSDSNYHLADGNCESNKNVGRRPQYRGWISLNRSLFKYKSIW